MERNLIIIRGPGGAGKTTIANLLAEKLRDFSKVAVLAADTFYWDISGKEINSEIVYEGIKRLEDLYLSNGYTVIIEGILSNKDDEGKPRIEQFIELGEKYNSTVDVFHLSAPIEILMQREKEKFKQKGWDFKENEFLEWYQKTQQIKYEKEILIDVSKLSSQNIVEQILHLSKIVNK